MKFLLKVGMAIRITDANGNATEPKNNEKGGTINMKTQKTTHKMKRNFIWILTGLMLNGLLSLASISLAEENTWIKKTDMPTARMGCGASAVDGKIYVIGGYLNNLTGLSTVEAYDPETDTWEKNADMPTPRLTLATSVVNGKIYAIGGYSNGRLTTVEEYDPVEDVWTKKANMPTARNWLATSVVKGKIYAIGGFNGLFTVEEYYPLTDTWTRKANMPTGRWGLSTGVANGKIYAFGGAIGEKAPLSTVEEYDPATDTWTNKGDMPKARAWLANHSPTVNGKIYVIGGGTDHDGAGLPTLEEYDPLADTWTKKANMPTARMACGASTVDGKIYAIGGWSNFVPFSTVEEYDTGFVPSKSIEATCKLSTTWGEIKHSR